MTTGVYNVVRCAPQNHILGFINQHHMDNKMNNHSLILTTSIFCINASPSINYNTILVGNSKPPSPPRWGLNKETVECDVNQLINRW